MVDPVSWSMVGQIGAVRSVKRHLNARPTVEIGGTPAVLVAHAHLFPQPHLQNPLAKGGMRYIDSLIKPEHTRLRLTCQRDAPNWLGMAQFEGTFDPNQTAVCDTLYLNSPMDRVLLRGSLCGWAFSPSQFCLAFVKEVKSMGAFDSSLRHVWTIAWALRKYGYLIYPCALHHGSPTSCFSYG
jgi:hypothetical protein